MEKNDKLFLLPIYPARELPIEGVSSEMLLQDSLKDKATCLSKDAFLDTLKKEQNPELLIMAGAGDIDAMVEPVKQILMSKA